MERGRQLRWRHHADPNADANANADSDAHPDTDTGANAEPDAHPDTNAHRRHVRAGMGGRHGLQRGRHRQPCGHELPRQLLDAGRQPVDQLRRRRHGQAVDQPGNLQHHANTDPDAYAYSNPDTYSDTNAYPYANANANANANGPRSGVVLCAVGRVWPRL